LVISPAISAEIGAAGNIAASGSEKPRHGGVLRDPSVDKREEGGVEQQGKRGSDKSTP
jgi:hypothetical protein